MRLRSHNIRNGGCIHRNISVTPIALYGCNIPIGGYIHWNTDAIPTALRACYIRNILHIHDRFDHSTNIFGVHFTRYLCKFTAFIARH